ncbi:hypothetical protein [Aliamphritea spongicola]|nr:hypothetical protein [Aliamphritea spongicola]
MDINTPFFKARASEALQDTNLQQALGNLKQGFPINAPSLWNACQNLKRCGIRAGI